MGRREAYLEALGLTAWERRESSGPPKPADVASPDRETPRPDPAPQAHAPPPSPEAPVSDGAEVRVGVALGPGQGGCLYLCGAGDDVSSPLASDLARILAEAPVWAQVADDGGQPLEAAIAERLFTQVVVFGAAQAQLVFGGDAPERCGPARVTVAPDLKRLAGDPRARKRCWSLLRSAGVVAAS